MAAAILFILGVMYLGLLLILLIKILEGLVRVLWRIPFDKSSHTIDSGLFGVLGLIGCCGSRRRKNQAQQRRRSVNALDGKHSSVSGSHQFAIGKAATPRSSSASPTSQPFREDTDDDNGYIMSAWQPFPQPGYSSTSNVTPSDETPKSSFTRVAGGRAHYDAPYSIARSSQGLEFPSTERITQRPSPTPPPASRYSAADTSSNRSTVTVNHLVSSGLPPGAMSPARPVGHVRTKSQTAVVEDASILFAARAAAAGPSTQSATDEPLRPPQIVIDTDDSSSDATQPKRNHWYNFRRNRRMSDGNVDEELAQAASSSAADRADNSGGGNTGRSFVVLRAKRPGSAGNQESSEPQTTAEPESQQQEGRRSFVVIRGNSNSVGLGQPVLSTTPGKSSRRSSFA